MPELRKRLLLLAGGFVVVGAFAQAACSTPEGDLPVEAQNISPAGTGERIRDVADPGSKKHAAHEQDVNVTGVTVVAIDNFDETNNGKSRGTIYVSDLGSSEPYSGIGLFAPSFIPSDLKVGPGDVLDLAGKYQENASIGTAIFPDGGVLPQIARPTATFRFETKVPTPVVIDVKDLATFETGRKWIGMLVTVKDVTLQENLVRRSGRVAGGIYPSDDPRNAPTLVNELYDLQEGTFPKGTKFASITGVVSYFFNLHLAPRSAEDIVVTP